MVSRQLNESKSSKLHIITNKQSCKNLKIGTINIENSTSLWKLLGVR